jgi:hypothetical protein
MRRPGPPPLSARRRRRRPPHTVSAPIPDTVTAVLGILLAVTVLASVGHFTPGQQTESPCAIDKEAR